MVDNKPSTEEMQTALVKFRLELYYAAQRFHGSQLAELSELIEEITSILQIRESIK